MKNLILILLIVFATRLYSQSTNDLLNEKLGEFTIENFNQLQTRGLITKMDMMFLSMYMVKMAQNELYFPKMDRYCGYRAEQRFDSVIREQSWRTHHS